MDFNFSFVPKYHICYMKSPYYPNVGHTSGCVDNEVRDGKLVSLFKTHAFTPLEVYSESCVFIKQHQVRCRSLECVWSVRDSLKLPWNPCQQLFSMESGLRSDCQHLHLSTGSNPSSVSHKPYFNSAGFPIKLFSFTVHVSVFVCVVKPWNSVAH